MQGAVTQEMLERIEVFKNIHHVSKKQLMAHGLIKCLKKGDFLFHAKDNVCHLYAVLSGKVSMHRMNSEGQKRVFFILGEGEIINEVVFDDLPVSVECDAFEASLVFQIGKTELLKIMSQDFALTMNIMNAIGRKQRRLYRQLKNTLPIGIEKKLAAKLWKLSKDHGEFVKDPTDAKSPWKQMDMALSITYLSYMLGTSREVTSRAMKVLQELGACKWEGKTLLVKENDLLDFYRA